MKFIFAIVLIAFAAALTFKSSEAAVTFESSEDDVLPPNSFPTPPPSGICLNKREVPANGTQIETGFCSSDIIGEIPSSEQMTSTFIFSPKNGEILIAHLNFTVKVEVINLHTGFFSDPDTDYYDLPQQLDHRGFIKGHSHIVIQKLDEDKINPPDPTTFAFFKGLNNHASHLSQVVGTQKNPGLPPGFYRLCTMASSFSHQPVVMPVAKRGSQDDCIRFSVGIPVSHDK